MIVEFKKKKKRLAPWSLPVPRLHVPRALPHVLALGPGWCSVTSQSHQTGEAPGWRSHLATGEAGKCGCELVGLCPDKNHQGAVTTELKREIGANQQPAVLWNLKEWATPCVPGRAPPPLIGNLGSDREWFWLQESTAGLSTRLPPQGLPPAFSLGFDLFFLLC